MAFVEHVTNGLIWRWKRVILIFLHMNVFPCVLYIYSFGKFPYELTLNFGMEHHLYGFIVVEIKRSHDSDGYMLIVENRHSSLFAC